jgi:hypothetical protein
MSSEPRYWVVGANWGGDDQREPFFRRGYWTLGWSDSDQPGMAAARKSIVPGDRIAIKSMLGQGFPDIAIRGLGIVKEVGEDKRVYVEWILTDLNRIVPSRGCYSAIHGPYTIGEEAIWLGQVFRL